MQVRLEQLVLQVRQEQQDRKEHKGMRVLLGQQDQLVLQVRLEQQGRKVLKVMQVRLEQQEALG